MTFKQQKDIECIKYFIPEYCNSVSITDKDIENRRLAVWEA